MPDLPGTGDHHEPLEAAGVDRWRAALAALVGVAGQGRAVHMLGVRGGALIAPAEGLATLYRLAPPADGAKIWRDLLRARSAAARERGMSESVATLDAASRAGAPIDIAGYDFTPALAESLRTAAPRASHVPHAHRRDGTRRRNRSSTARAATVASGGRTGCRPARRRARRRLARLGEPSLR